MKQVMPEYLSNNSIYELLDKKEVKVKVKGSKQ